MKKILYYLIALFVLVSCTKEEVVSSYVRPILSIDSCLVNDNAVAAAYITVDKGENFFSYKLEMMLHDVSNLDQPVDVIDIPLNDERTQHLKTEFALPEKGNVYVVSLKLTTDKNSFVGNSLLINTSGMQFEDKFPYLHGVPYFYNDPGTYLYRTADVGAIVSAEDNFLLSVDCVFENETFQVKVDGKLIQTELTINVNDNKYEIFGVCPDLPAGKYDVSIIWNGNVEIPVEQKLQIIPRVDKVATCSVEEFEYLPHSTTDSYRIGNKMYYCSIYSDAKTHVVYDYATTQWTKLNDIPYNISSITSLGDKAYAITNNYYMSDDQTEIDHLVEYDPSTDNWEIIADFPNKGNLGYMHIFVAAGNLYMCDGSIPKEPFGSFEHIYNTWKYDLGRREWEAMGDYPSELGDNGGHRVEYFSGESVAYAMDYANKRLWTYNPANDKWTCESILKADFEIDLGLIEYNDKLLMFGYGSNSSVYVYDIKTRTWEFFSLYHYYFARSPIILPMGIYNNKLMVGPFMGIDYPFECMYFLTVDVK